MTRNEIISVLTKAQEEGWNRIDGDLPEPGERVDVMHVLNRSYDCDGEIDADGKWHCCNGFILPGMSITFTPTHWRAKNGQPVRETV